MNSEDNLYERIDGYLNETLSDEDRKSFEKEMAKYPSLAEEVEMQKLVHVFILESSLNDIRIQVGKDLDRSSRYPWKKIIISSILFIFIAAEIYWVTESFNKEIPSVPNTADSISHLNTPCKENIEKKVSTTDIKNKKKTIISKSLSLKNDTSLFEKLLITPDSDKISLEQHHFSTDTSNDHNLLKTKPSHKYVKEEMTIPCPDILFSIHTEHSCNNTNSGSIQILLSSILGGEPPYRYTIDGKAQSLLNDLAVGTYNVTVIDTRGCNSDQQAIISEKNCVVFKDYSFNPETETLKLPFPDLESGTLSIMDKSGNLVYKTDIINGQLTEWNGRSMNGSTLEMGSYLYIATSVDGKTKQGYIILLH